MTTVRNTSSSTPNQRNKARALAFWQELDAAPERSLARVCRSHLARGFVYRGPAPLPTFEGPESFAEGHIAPLKRALPRYQTLTHIFMGGKSEGKADGSPDGRMWVGTTGYLVGEHTGEYVGIPASGTRVRVRFGDFLRFDGDDIVEGQGLLDLADWCEQIGRPILPRSTGAPFVYPAPTGISGVLSGPQPPRQTNRSLDLCRDLLFAGLNKFDRKSLKSMGMAGFFHPNIKWYGPGGIGACLSLAEFQDLHQQPWLVAFPDRKVQDLDCLFAEGPFVGSCAFAGVRATHGGPYLGTPASHRQIAVNGIDFWLRQGDQFVENWVFVDMVHLFGQFGVDLLARARGSRR